MVLRVTCNKPRCDIPHGSLAILTCLGTKLNCWIEALPVQNDNQSYTSHSPEKRFFGFPKRNKAFHPAFLLKGSVFQKRTCDGLCRLQVFSGFGWNIKVVSIVNLDLCKTHCKQVPDFSHLCGSDLIKWASFSQFLQFLPSGQYGLCFGYCFSGPLPLRSHIEQITFSRPFLGVPSLLDYTGNRPEPSLIALKLSVSTRLQSYLTSSSLDAFAN